MCILKIWMRYIIDLFKFKRFRGGRKTDLFKRSAFYLELKKTNAFGQGIEVYGTLNRTKEARLFDNCVVRDQRFVCEGLIGRVGHGLGIPNNLIIRFTVYSIW